MRKFFNLDRYVGSHSAKAPRGGRHEVRQKQGLARPQRKPEHL